MFKKQIRNNFFRCLIYGSTGSGKTYFLLNTLIPMIKDQYDDIFVFTRSFNKKDYKDYPCVFKNHYNILKKLISVQEKKKEAKRGNILIIWDDILDKKLFDKKEFKEQFINLRHLNVSLILLTQICNKIIATEMKGNTEFSVFFRINHRAQRRELIQKICECLDDEDELIDKQLIVKAKKIYKDKIKNKKYGYLIFNYKDQILNLK